MTNFKAVLYELSKRFEGADREIMIAIMNSGDDEKIRAAVFEAEEKLERRSKG